MNRIILALFALALCNTAHATDYNVQRNGAPLFCALAVTISGTTYNFQGDCGVTPPPPPAEGRQTVGRVAYQSSGVAVRDLTEWNSVFGHATPYDAMIAWPGRHNSQPTIIDFVRGKYVALHVHTNALGQIPTAGFIVHTEYNAGFDPSISWSRAAGDFSSSLGANCYAAVVLSGGTLGKYATPLTGYLSSCHLPPNADVYFNIKMADPNQDTSTCHISQRVCPFGMSNNFG